MRIAIITAGNSTDTGGIMSFVCEEALQFNKREADGVSCDVYMIRWRPSFLLRVLLNVIKGVRVESFVFPDNNSPFFIKDGVTFNNLWVEDNLYSFFKRTRYSHKYYNKNSIKFICSELKHYDYIIAHKPECHSIGIELWERFKVPFGAFWHGSELAIASFSSKYVLDDTKKILEEAHDNFFVSKALMNISDGITKKGNRKVIYTGPSDMFNCFSQERKLELRDAFNIPTGAIVVAYAGHLIDLKNVMLLPVIFKRLQEKCRDKQFHFWIIGHGEQENQLRAALDIQELPYVMFGNVPSQRMPEYMNCIDILLLISKKEGLGLVCLEAMKCGASVYGSLVGGIPEVIGEENCVPLNDDFVERITDLVADRIHTQVRNTTYDDRFSWPSAIDEILKSIKAIR